MPNDVDMNTLDQAQTAQAEGEPHTNMKEAQIVDIDSPKAITIKDIPTSILYRHQKAYLRKKLPNDPDFRAKNKARALKYYHKHKDDPDIQQKRGEQAARSKKCARAQGT